MRQSAYLHNPSLGHVQAASILPSNEHSHVGPPHHPPTDFHVEAVGTYGSPPDQQEANVRGHRGRGYG